MRDRGEGRTEKATRRRGDKALKSVRLSGVEAGRRLSLRDWLHLRTESFHQFLQLNKLFCLIR
jgi:hypothetical protein